MGVSLVVTGFFLVVTVALLVILLLFVNGRRYRKTAGPLSPAEFVAVRREVERRVSLLAPRMLLLEEKRRAAEEVLEYGALWGELRGRFEALISEAPMAGAWRRFSAVSALADELPLEALGELKEVSWMVETAISKLVEAESLCDARERA